MARPRKPITQRSRGLNEELKYVSYDDSFLVWFEIYELFRDNDVICESMDALMFEAFQNCTKKGLTEWQFIERTLRKFFEAKVKSSKILSAIDVDDLINDTMEKRVWAPGKYDPTRYRADRTAFLLRAANHELIDHIRRIQKRREREVLVGDDVEAESSGCHPDHVASPEAA